MPKVQIDDLVLREGSSYPSPFDEPCQKRRVMRLSGAVGLSQFGVNLIELPPGELPLGPGECAGWPAGVRNGHHIVNQGEEVARFLVVGSRDDEDHGEYPDIDMIFTKGRYSGRNSQVFRRKDGTPY
jgi:uncharacterized cupin superfamily protein